MNRSENIILCPCYNTQFYYRRVCKISIIWRWCIIRNFTLYINHVRSCCKSLLPPFPIMNCISYVYLVFDLWKGRKCTSNVLHGCLWLVKAGEWFQPLYLPEVWAVWNSVSPLVLTIHLQDSVDHCMSHCSLHLERCQCFIAENTWLCQHMCFFPVTDSKSFLFSPLSLSCSLFCGIFLVYHRLG